MLPPAAMHLEQKESTEKMTGTQQYLHQYRNKYYHDDRHQHPGHPQKQQDCHRYRRHYRNDHHYHHHHHHYHHRHHRYKHHQLSSQTDQQLQNGSRNSRNTDYRRTISPLSSTISLNDNSSSIQHANMFVTGKIKNKSLIQSIYIESSFNNENNILLYFLIFYINNNVSIEISN